MRTIPTSTVTRFLLARGLCAVITTAALLGVAQAASMAPVAAENGMVVTAQHLATEVGVDVLRRGGNAVDAAIAVGYALAVVYPAAGNLGGGGFMTVQLADGKKTFLDFREKAPLAATAASTALPPRRSTSTPTSVARCCAVTTMPFSAATGAIEAA